MHPRRIRALTIAIAVSSPLTACALTIQFDYSHDTTNFFVGHPDRQALLDQAASTFSSFTDSLLGITPGGVNTWTATFIEPTTGTTGGTALNLTIPANTMKIFVGASPLSGNTLGFGGPGGFTGSGTQSFVNSVSNRGQTGSTSDPATATDFGRWGGGISFSSTASWFFGATTAGLGGSQNDFLSVAIHEIGHVLGIGTANSFKHYLSGTTFTGPTAESKHGGTAVPTLADGSHWAEGTSSFLPNTSGAQEAAMDPTIDQGTRKLFTVLDYAGLKDVGWEVPASLLTYTPPNLVGDTNDDGVVDLADLNNVLNNFGSHTAGNIGDDNHDGVVDLGDLNNVLNNFGSHAAASALVTVPEPTTLAACVVTGLTLLTRRHRRQAPAQFQ